MIGTFIVRRNIKPVDFLILNYENKYYFIHYNYQKKKINLTSFEWKGFTIWAKK